MRIEGEYTFQAPLELVWGVLNDPQKLRRAIPGCEHLHLHADGKYHLTVVVADGPFAGSYESLVALRDERPQEALLLAINGHGPETVFDGRGAFTLKESGDQTTVYYEGDVQVSGHIPSRSPRLVRTTSNYFVRTFFEGLAEEISQLTGDASDHGLPPEESFLNTRLPATITMQDFLQELRRDRWVAALLLAAGLIATLSLFGVVFLGILLVRWSRRVRVERAAASNDAELGAGEL